MCRISSDDSFTQMAVVDIDAAAAVPIATYQPGQYVACIYDQDWYIGNVVEIAEEHDDVLVTLMTRRVSRAIPPWRMLHSERLRVISSALIPRELPPGCCQCVWYMPQSMSIWCHREKCLWICMAWWLCEICAWRMLLQKDLGKNRLTLFPNCVKSLNDTNIFLPLGWS